MGSSNDNMILMHSWCSCVRLNDHEVLVHVYLNQDLSFGIRAKFSLCMILKIGFRFGFRLNLARDHVDCYDSV
jgi:hypothetical protein